VPPGMPRLSLWQGSDRWQGAQGGLGTGRRRGRIAGTARHAAVAFQAGTRSGAGTALIRTRIREYAFQAGCREFESRLPLHFGRFRTVPGITSAGRRNIVTSSAPGCDSFAT
jgi:hypothetical protein